MEKKFNTIEAVILWISGLFIGMYIGAIIQEQVDKKDSYPTIKVEQLDSLRKVYRVNIEVNDIYLHGEIYKIKTSD